MSGGGLHVVARQSRGTRGVAVDVEQWVRLTTGGGGSRLYLYHVSVKYPGSALK